LLLVENDKYTVKWEILFAFTCFGDRFLHDEIVALPEGFVK
jgi:hypothetical protein